MLAGRFYLQKAIPLQNAVRTAKWLLISEDIY